MVCWVASDIYMTPRVEEEERKEEEDGVFAVVSGRSNKAVALHLSVVYAADTIADSLDEGKGERVQHDLAAVRVCVSWGLRDCCAVDGAVDGAAHTLGTLRRD